MFYRLITNLQYSPGLIGQVSFYARRLQREEFVRRIGLIFSVMALTLQAFLIFSPPQPSLASSANDIIYGGGDKAKIAHSIRTSRDDLGRNDVAAIYARFGITAENVEAAQDVVIQSRAENNFYSIGRQSRFSSQIETIIDVPGAAPVYSRPLHAWDSGAYSTYYAIYGTNNEGKEFWILKNCGNVVMKTPTPEPLPPTLEIIKTIYQQENYYVKRGDEIVYSIRYRNAGPGAAGFMTIEDLVPNFTTLVEATGPVRSTANNLVKWDHTDETANPYGILGATDWFHEVYMKVRVNNDAPNGQVICNTAKISAINHGPVNTPPVCREVEVPTEPPVVTPTAVCSAITAEKISRDTYKFTGTGNTADGATISKFNFDTGDEQIITADNSGANSAEITHTYAAPGEYVIKLSLDSSVGSITSRECRTLITVDEPEGTPEIVHNKEVKNLTQEVDNANGTVAKAGDRLEYKLITRNLGTVAAVDFALPAEDIADVLEYADIEELNDATYNKDTQTLTWPNQTIEPGARIEKVFIVKVKDPIPQTPVSASDAGSYDLVMSNSYGNDQVEIKLPPANNKRVETVARSLPNTGIGDNLITSAFLMGTSTYFYSRNRMISKELKLVKKEFIHG
jgi:uncharacterized repeat protein (TIGR01451 family)